MWHSLSLLLILVSSSNAASLFTPTPATDPSICSEPETLKCVRGVKAAFGALSDSDIKGYCADIENCTPEQKDCAVTNEFALEKLQKVNDACSPPSPVGATTPESVAQSSTTTPSQDELSQTPTTVTTPELPVVTLEPTTLTTPAEVTSGSPQTSIPSTTPTTPVVPESPTATTPSASVESTTGIFVESYTRECRARIRAAGENADHINLAFTLPAHGIPLPKEIMCLGLNDEALMRPALDLVRRYCDSNEYQFLRQRANRERELYGCDSLVKTPIIY